MVDHKYRTMLKLKGKSFKLEFELCDSERIVSRLPIFMSWNKMGDGVPE